MFRGDSLGVDLVPGISQFQQDARHGIPFLIRLFEKPCGDDALSIEEERARERNAVVRGAGIDRRIEKSVRFDRGRALVRQQRERDASPPREVGEDRRRVIRHHRYG